MLASLLLVFQAKGPAFAVPVNPEMVRLLDGPIPQKPIDKERALAEIDAYLLPNGITYNVTGCNPMVTRSIERAVKMWKTYLPLGPVRDTSDDSAHKITIVWTTIMRQSPRHQAELESERTFHWGAGPSYDFNATLYAKSAAEGRALSEDELVQMFAHEMGHAMGLEDRGKGIMGPLRLGSPICRPAEEEVATLNRLRTLLSLRRTAIAAK